MKYFEFIKLCYDKQELIKFLVNRKIINLECLCHKCGKLLKLNNRGDRLRCRNTFYTSDGHTKKHRVQCNTSYSPFNNSIFNKCKIGIQKLCMLLATYFCIDNIKRKFLSTHLDISLNTIGRYIKLSECVIARWVKNKYNKQIGGVGKVVQIDETKIGWRKFNRGRYERGVWIFGGVEIGSKRAFMIAVKDRSSDTLSKAIKRRIKTSTRIYSDCWKGYCNLRSMGYRHYTVNHSKRFINRYNKVNTQTIERAWRELKSSIPKYGNNIQNVNRKISKFMFNRYYSDERRIKALFNILGDGGTNRC